MLSYVVVAFVVVAVVDVVVAVVVVVVAGVPAAVVADVDAAGVAVVAVAEHSVVVEAVADNMQDWWHAADDAAADGDDLDIVENQNNNNVDASRDWCCCWEDFGGDVGRHGHARHSSFLIPSLGQSADEADRQDLHCFDDVMC